MIITKVEAEFLIKTDVFIHHQGQFFSPDSRFIIGASYPLTIALSFDHWSFLFISHWCNFV